MIEYINTYFIGWSPRGFSESNIRVTDDVGETGSSYEITVIAFTYCNRNAILLNPVCIETMFTGHLALMHQGYFTLRAHARNPAPPVTCALCIFRGIVYGFCKAVVCNRRYVLELFSFDKKKRNQSNQERIFCSSATENVHDLWSENKSSELGNWQLSLMCIARQKAAI